LVSVKNPLFIYSFNMKKKCELQTKIILCILAGIVLFSVFSLIVHLIFIQGLKRYYCLEPADVLCLGHSMTEMGIDKTLLEEKTGKKIAKFCMNGAGTQDRLVMLKQYIESTGTQPKLVIYDVSARSFSEGLSSNSYALFYPFMGESNSVDEYIRNEATFWEYWQKKLILLSRYDDTRLGAVFRGFQGNWENIQTREIDIKNYEKEIEKGHFWKITFDPDAIKSFDETLQYLQEKNITVLLLVLPSVSQLNNAEPEQYQRAMAMLRARCENQKDIIFLDLNPSLSIQSKLFFDPIHLNRNGQIIVTNILANWFIEREQ